MTQITDFIPQYQEVNVIFSRFLESEKFGFEEQKNITHFYNRYKDVKLFEKMIFDIIFSKDSRREKMLLSSSLRLTAISPYTKQADATSMKLRWRMSMTMQPLSIWKR